VNEQLNISTSRSYTPDITPVILAAHRDNYEIVKILLERGEKVTEPHDVRCDCDKCLVYNKEDSLRHSRSRINAYKALSSPCYISLSSRDPIMTAFDLNRELKRLSRIENEFKQEYEQLAQQCQDYSAALLAETRSSKELEIILNYDSENPPVLTETTEKMTLSRLKLAIRYKQKKFVSHSHCQQLLASLWYEGLPGFRRRHSVIQILITSIVGLLFPIFSIAYLLIPRSSIGRIMRQPFIKFICHSVSYIFFLILLFVVSLRIDFGELLSDGEISNERRGPPPNPVELAIMVYVAGFIWAEIKQLYQEGLHQYMADTWNLLDWVTNCLYVATIVLRVMAYIKVNREERDLQGQLAPAHVTSTTSSVHHSHSSHNLTSDPAAISTGHYVRRRDWNAWDPTLISEGIFAAANIFSSLKLVYIFTINPHLGPLQISLGRMVHDILKFSVMILLVAFAFACGLNQLFWYYARMKKSECEMKISDDEYCAKEIYKHFSNLFESLQTLFWGTFGLIDLQTFQIYKKHTFTMFIGLLMYGVYSSIMIIVLLNMLIAMMSNSYQYIANSTETEWKFARAKLWTSYFEDGGTLPPPFNIVPSPKSICYSCRYLYRRVFGCSKTHLRNRWQSIKKILVKINEREVKYQTVIRELVKRYIMKRQQKDQTEGVTEDDLNEIKQDVSAFRFELLEILSTNGFKVQSLKKNPGL
jgi:transient receptor potential cation channel subfamily C protein 4